MPRRKNHAAAAAREVFDAEKKLKIMRQWIAARREAVELEDFLTARATGARDKREWRKMVQRRTSGAGDRGNIGPFARGARERPAEVRR